MNAATQVIQITSTNLIYLLYKYDYDSQTNSEFEHNCKEWSTLQKFFPQ